MATCDILDLCIEAVADPDNDNVILIRETEEPTVIVRTSRENWQAFLDGVKAGNFDNV